MILTQNSICLQAGVTQKVCRNCTNGTSDRDFCWVFLFFLFSFVLFCFVFFYIWRRNSILFSKEKQERKNIIINISSCLYH